MLVLALVSVVEDVVEGCSVVAFSGIPKALEPVVQDVARMVSARRGTLPFLVNLRLADLEATAERRARWREPMGTSRLITPVLDSRM